MSKHISFSQTPWRRTRPSVGVIMADSRVLYVALDSSMHSPAMAIKAPDGSLTIVCFCKTVPERATLSLSPNVLLVLHPASGPAMASRWGRVLSHRHSFVSEVTTIKQRTGATTVRMAHEDYAYGCARSAAARTILQLAEDLGVILAGMFEQFAVISVPVSISTVKYAWSRNGRATKAMMHVAWRERGLPDLEPHFHGWAPQSDVVDCVAVLHAAFNIESKP